MLALARSWLSSQRAWDATGLSLPSAMIATRGGLRTFQGYLAESRSQMAPVIPFVTHQKTVLELGCGLGGNLIVLSSHAGRGIGVDVNRRYLRLAEGLARRAGRHNTSFLRYDGVTVPLRRGTIDVSVCYGVFERLEHALVQALVGQLYRVTKPGGMARLFFLTNRARGTNFARFLGEDAYHFWDDAAAAEMCCKVGWTPIGSPTPEGNARRRADGATVQPGSVLTVVREGP